MTHVYRLMYSSGLKLSSFSFSRTLRSLTMPFCSVEGDARGGEGQIEAPG